MQYYQLQIESKHNINEMFNCSCFKQTGNLWIYEISEEETTDYVNFFIELIKKNKDKLEKNDITSHNITIWILYEYDEQCSLCISTKNMKMLSEENIELCIDCWQKDSSVDLGEKIKVKSKDFYH